ncbi:MAG TPA: histidine phosphatase family protein [Leptolyngbyaceae cyanobacterium]
MQLFFVRHGESVANLLGEFSNRGIKHPLTPKGKSQAIALARQLKDKTFIKLYSSPLLRAQQTSEILASAFNLEITITDALREFDVGIYEGTSDPEGWQAYKEVVRVWLWQQDKQRRLPEGESFQDLLDRFVPFLAELTVNFGDRKEGILLVGHGGLYRCVLPDLLSNISYEFSEQHPIDNVSFILAEYQNGQLFCRQWCDRTI